MLGVEFEMTHIQNTEQFQAFSSNIGDKPEISGDPDKFQLLMKASNTRLSKSTKVMNLDNGCLIQVSTREILKDQSIALAEALAFVPDLNVRLEKSYEDRKLEKSYENRKPDKDERVRASFIRIGRAS